MKDLFGRLDAVVSDRTLLHTNTSTLSVTGIASGSKLLERVVGTHYCNPAPLMKLVEVVPGRRTADWARDTTWENSIIAALDAGSGTTESAHGRPHGRGRRPGPQSRPRLLRPCRLSVAVR